MGFEFLLVFGLQHSGKGIDPDNVSSIIKCFSHHVRQTVVLGKPYQHMAFPVNGLHIALPSNKKHVCWWGFIKPVPANAQESNVGNLLGYSSNGTAPVKFVASAG